MKEYDVEIKQEKSALERFADKYVTEGKPGVVPLEYFTDNYLPSLIKHFMRNHRSIKILMIMVIELEKNIIEKKEWYHIQDEAYFYSEKVHILKNLEKTDTKEDFQASHNGWALGIFYDLLPWLILITLYVDDGH